MDADIITSAPTASCFGPIHVLEPRSQHTHTAILLHGRGSTGEEFAEELLLESRLSGQMTLAQKLPRWRWVFPSSRTLWSTTFEEEMPTWFEAHSLTDVSTGQNLQVRAIRESVKHVMTILDKEIDRLGGAAEKVALGGISQGGAIGLWTLLCSENPARQLGAFVGASTWLPFAESIEDYLGRDETGGEGWKARLESRETDTFVESMMAPLKRSLAGPYNSRTLLSTPVFLGHGADDAYVDIQLGRRAWHVLTQVGLKAKWKEYSGAEQEGHWLKVPEELDDIAEFLTIVCP